MVGRRGGGRDRRCFEACGRGRLLSLDVSSLDSSSHCGELAASSSRLYWRPLYTPLVDQTFCSGRGVGGDWSVLESDRLRAVDFFYFG